MRLRRVPIRSSRALRHLRSELRNPTGAGNVRRAVFASEGPNLRPAAMAGTSNPSPEGSAAIPFVRDDEDASGQNAAARVHQDAAQKFALLPGLDQ